MIRDTKTIDCLSNLQFKDWTARERWLKISQHDYFQNHDSEITINFARRWAKNIQFLMKNDSRNFNELIVPAAYDANIDNGFTPSHLEKAIELLVEIWEHGDSLKEWLDNGGKSLVETKLF